MTLSDRSCIILAGGLGTRLRGIVPDAPKVLAPVQNVPFLTFLLWQVEMAGLRHVILSTGHRADAVEQAFGSAFGKLRIEYSREPKALGTGGAVRLASVRAQPGTVLVMNGDSYCDLNFAEFAEAHEASGSQGTLALAYLTDTSRFGRVACASDGRILEFMEKVPSTVPGHINAGIYWMEPEFVESIPCADTVSLERDVFPRSLQAGVLFGWNASRRFIDIGTPESYREANAFFANALNRSSL